MNLHYLILHRDADPARRIGETLHDAGHHATVCPDAEAVRTDFARAGADVIVIDNTVTESVELLRALRREHPELEIILVLSKPDEQPQRTFGAFDVLHEPVHTEAVRSVARRLADKRALLEQNRQLHAALAERDRLLARTGAQALNLYNVTRWIHSAGSLNRVYQIAADGLSQLAGNRIVHLFRLDPDADQLRGVASSRLEQEAIASLRIALPELLVGDLERAEYWSWLSDWLAECMQARTERILPISSLGRTVGVAVILQDGAPVEPPAIDDDVVTQFLLQAATAIGHAESTQRLEALSMRDPDTQLLNHRYFRERLAGEMQRARRHGIPLSVLLVGVDQLNAYNRDHGHEAGDWLLRRVASHLADPPSTDSTDAPVRRSDVVARYFGDIFAILLPHTPKNGALVKAGRVQRAAVEIDTPAGRGHVTLSVGLAGYPEDGVEPATLLEAAELALKTAKAAGGDCVRAAKARRGAVAQTESIRAALGHSLDLTPGEPDENH